MNKIVKIICCAVLCIPLISAVIIGIMGKGPAITGEKKGNEGKDENSGSALVKVKIFSEDDTLIREYDDTEVLKMYLNAVNNSEPVSDMPSLADEVFTYYNINYVGSAEEYVYKFIMSSESEANCFFKDIDEQLYSLKADDARLLLVRDEFADVNKYGHVANLFLEYTKNTEPVSVSVDADTYTWNYTRLDGEVIAKADNDSFAELPTIVFPKSGTDANFTFNSDVAPSVVNMTVKRGTETVYSGEPAALPAYLNYNSDVTLDVTVDAEWLEAEDSKFYGNVKYNFKLLYDVPSTFKLSDLSLGAGEFTILEIVGGNHSEKITAQADFMSGITESFIYNGRQFIYIPIKVDTVPGSYEIKVTESAGIGTAKFEVSSKKKFETTEIILPSTEITQLLTEDNNKEYADLIGKYKHIYSEKMLWSNKFALPVANGKTICPFGYIMNITGNNKTAEGMYITAEYGTKVTAANSGKVIFAGATKLSGNTVIIDHGLGVLSYYMNLGSISCTNDAEVKKGDVIGTIGHTGYTPYTNTMLYANSVGGCFVNPETQIKYGISFPN